MGIVETNCVLVQCFVILAEGAQGCALLIRRVTVLVLVRACKSVDVLVGHVVRGVGAIIVDQIEGLNSIVKRIRDRTVVVNGIRGKQEKRHVGISTIEGVDRVPFIQSQARVIDIRPKVGLSVMMRRALVARKPT